VTRLLQFYGDKKCKDAWFSFRDDMMPCFVRRTVHYSWGTWMCSISSVFEACRPSSLVVPSPHAWVRKSADLLSNQHLPASSAPDASGSLATWHKPIRQLIILTEPSWPASIHCQLAGTVLRSFTHRSVGSSPILHLSTSDWQRLLIDLRT